MNRTNLLTRRTGSVLCGALFAAVSGCTTYVQQPTPVTYLPSPPEPTPPPRVYAPPPPVYAPPPAVEVSFTIRSENDFYEPLTPYGRWEMVGGYGRCWVPDRVESDWRPYSNGYWQRTDAGWYWASDEPWAWATYHYGRWDFEPRIGWYWVPQTQWSPAWVSFHEGGGYIGWAPLPPSARMEAGGSVNVNVSLIAPRAFVFVEQKRFLEPVRPQTVVVNNTTIINKTVNITNIKVVNNTVVNEGPRTTVIEQASGKKVAAVPVRELRREQEAAAVSRQRKTPPGLEKKIQPPDRREVAPSEPRVAPAREPRPVERPGVVTKETVAPTAPAPPAIQAPEKQPTERLRTQPVPAPAEARRETKPSVEREAKPTVESEDKPKVAREDKPKVVRDAKPTVEREGRPGIQREDRPGNQRDAKPIVGPAEQPVKGRGAERQVKGAKETSKGKSAEKGKKKNQEPETPPEKPASPP